MFIARMKEMFAEMVVKKDASRVPFYYHPEFVLYANLHVMDYPTFLETHREIYQTGIEYKVAYDEETLLEQGERVAARMWITTKRPEDATPKELELILILQYKEGKIYRVWELTYPDWSKLPDFEVFHTGKEALD